MSADSHSTDDIARVAYAIWESEGHPEGRDHEHWNLARQLIEEGRAEAEFPGALGSDNMSPRPVQPGFEDAAPGLTPEMKEDTDTELREDAGGRFAKQLDDLPERGKHEIEGVGFGDDAVLQVDADQSQVKRAGRGKKAKTAG